MRDVLCLPIAHDSVHQTWRYIGDVAELKPTLISVEDRRALLFSLQAATQLEGTPVCEQVGRISRTLLSTLPPERATAFERMMKSIRFTSPHTPKVKKAVWDAVLLSLEAKETLQITYSDGVFASTTQRQIDPYGLLMRDRRWILVAYCHYKKSVLTFSLFRISDAAITDKRFKMPANIMDRYLVDHFDGFQTTGPPSKFILRVATNTPPYVMERMWSENETRRVDEAGNLIIEFQTAALFAVEREVRANAPWVEILEPAECRVNLREAGQALASAHS